MSHVFFDNWEGLLRTAVIGVLAYFILIAILRLSGKRTLTKLNAFDLVVTVALGSTLATALLTKDVALAEGTLGFALLIGMQWVVASLNVRCKWFERAVSARPTLLLHRGEMLSQAMRRQRVTEGEVLAAVRGAGIARLDEIEGVVLESDGSLSVVRRCPQGAADSLRDVGGERRA